VSDLGTVLESTPTIGFHGVLELLKPTLRLAISHSMEFSSLRHSPHLMKLNRATTLLQLSGTWPKIVCQQALGLLTRTSQGTGILTSFPNFVRVS
jgi:hypothetical protein